MLGSRDTGSPPRWGWNRGVLAAGVLMSMTALLTSQTARAVIPPVPPGCPATTMHFSNDAPTAIPDGPAVITSQIIVSGLEGIAWDVDLTTFITHDFPRDLDITLTAPSGVIMTVTTDNGGAFADVFNGTVWDDQADPGGQVPYGANEFLANDHNYGNLVVAETLAPEESFMPVLVGGDPNGVWTLTISDDTALNGGMLHGWALDITTLPNGIEGDGTGESENTTALPIPAGPSVVFSTNTIGTITGTGDYILFVSVELDLSHTWNSDLDITLQSPEGTVVTLTSDNGGGHNDVFVNTTWNDMADPLDGQVPYLFNDGLATDHPYVNFVSAGSLVPEEAFAAFQGENPIGVWLLTISDDTGLDAGTLHSWKVSVTTIRQPDADDDGVGDMCDNCPDDANFDQADADGDGVGDLCDACDGDDAVGDTDGDGVCDDIDACEGFDDALDADGDGTPDDCDLCPDDPLKIDPGVCDCGTPDVDVDGDGTPDCDGLPEPDPAPGVAPNACCGGTAPAILPLMLGGWSSMRRRVRRKRRRA